MQSCALAFVHSARGCTEPRELRRQAVRGASTQPEKAALCVNIVPSRCSQDLVLWYGLLCKAMLSCTTRCMLLKVDGTDWVKHQMESKGHGTLICANTSFAAPLVHPLPKHTSHKHRLAHSAHTVSPVTDLKCEERGGGWQPGLGLAPLCRGTSAMA